MKLVDECIGSKIKYVIITGNGTSPETSILKKICEVYNGDYKTILFPRLPIRQTDPLIEIEKQTGLITLKAAKTIPKLGAKVIVFIVDGEHIKKDAITEVQKQLKDFGIGMGEIQNINGAFLIPCSFGIYKFVLYCIIAGPETCIEEEVVRLIELKYTNNIAVPEKRDKEWCQKIKATIENFLKAKGIKKEALFRNSSKDEIEKSFPNLCAVFKKIEEDWD